MRELGCAKEANLSSVCLSCTMAAIANSIIEHFLLDIDR